MPNSNYADKRDSTRRTIASDVSTMALPRQQGTEHIDETGQRGSKDPGGNMPMRYGTANWKMPGNSVDCPVCQYQMQPRDRSWGMRKCDGVVYDEGLAGPAQEGLEGSEDTYVDRGSVSKSAKRG